MTILAFCRKKLGDFEGAIISHKKAIELDGTFFRSYMHLANIYRLLNKSDEALWAYDQSLKIEDANANLYFQRGETLLRRGAFEEAEEEFNKCINIEPTHGGALCGLSEIRLKQGDIAAFYSNIEQALEQTPKMDWPCNLLVKKISEDFDGNELITKVKEKSGSALFYGSIFNSLANHFKEKGDITEELKQRLKAIEIEPDNEWLHRNLARYYQRNNNLEKARGSILEAISINSNAHELFCIASGIEFDAGSFEDAKRFMLKALNIKEDVHYLWALGLCSEYLDKTDDAIKYYELALELNPNHQRSLEDLGMLYEQLGTAERSLELSNRLKEARK